VVHVAAEDRLHAGGLLVVAEEEQAPLEPGEVEHLVQDRLDQAPEVRGRRDVLRKQAEAQEPLLEVAAVAAAGVGAAARGDLPAAAAVLPGGVLVVRVEQRRPLLARLDRVPEGAGVGPSQGILGVGLVVDVEDLDVAQAEQVVELERHGRDLAPVQERAVLAPEVDDPEAALGEGLHPAVPAGDLEPVELQVVLRLAPEGDRLGAERVHVQRLVGSGDHQLGHGPAPHLPW
jgi:hypothetical protein